MPFALPFIAVAATVGSLVEQRKAGKAARAQADAERRRADVENVRNVRQQIRAARLAQASIVNQSALSGTMGSSGMLGGISSVGSQLSGNINYMSQIAEENTNIFNAQVNQAKASANAAMWGTIGSTARTIFSDVYPGTVKGGK